MMIYWKRTFVVLGLIGGFALIGARDAAGQTLVTIRAAVVTSDLTVKPIPLLDLNIITIRPDTHRVQTNLQGVASLRIPPGSYRIESTRAIEFAGHIYTWIVPFSAAGQYVEVELTPSNARAEKLAMAPQQMAGTAPNTSLVAKPLEGTGRKVSEEAAVYELVHRSIFTIFGEGSKGSGFLVDTTGLVITNAHVVANSKYFSVMTDQGTRVPAKLLASSKDKDVAVLGIHPDAIRGRLPLQLATAKPLAVIGERVLAIGSPLTTSSSLTTGVVSNIAERALVTDVNINQGNSGGPLLNLAGEVVAINTFLIGASYGPGLSGSIAIDLAIPFIAQARDSLFRLRTPLEYKLLPTEPTTPFPQDAWKQAATLLKMDVKPYAATAGVFDLLVMTPPLMAWRINAAERAMLERRQKRERKADADENTKVDPLQNWYEWTEYTNADRRKPLIVINVVPKSGQTAGSFWGNLIGAFAAGYTGRYYAGRYTYEFKGDFEEMTLLRNGEAIEPILRGRAPMAIDYDDGVSNFQDYAHQGIYTYHPDVFAPDSMGRVPTIILRVSNLSKPNEQTTFTLSDRTIAAVWNDFMPWRLSLKQTFPQKGQPAGLTSAEQLSVSSARIPDSQKQATTEQPKHVSVLITSTPWANLIIDGVERGTAPQTLTLAPGQHELVLSRDGFRDVKTTIDVRPGVALSFAFKLEKF